jgi:hypothetical protein
LLLMILAYLYTWPKEPQTLLSHVQQTLDTNYWVLWMLATTEISSMYRKLVSATIIGTYWFRFLSPYVGNLQSLIMI